MPDTVPELPPNPNLPLPAPPAPMQPQHTAVATGVLLQTSNNLEWAWRKGIFLTATLEEQMQVLGNLQMLNRYLPSPG